MKALDEGIGFYESLRDGVDAINVKRELAVSWQKRGDVLLMNGDVDGALEVYRQAHRVLDPMAKADPQNTMLQLDVASMEYHEARALTSNGKFDEAIPKLRHALAVFEQLHAPTRSADDSPRGPGSIYIWLGEASAGQHDLAAARQYYQKAINSLAADLERSPDDDIRCELAVSYTKMANLLATARNPHDAFVAYQKALGVASVGAGLEHQDVPALYVLADAYAGMGDVRLADARRTPDAALGSKFFDEARTLYESSLTAWNKVPNPSRIASSGYAAGDPRAVDARLTRLRAYLDHQRQ
jgi:tetratricopeptide (TPR) repeat protein